MKVKKKNLFLMLALSGIILLASLYGTVSKAEAKSNSNFVTIGKNVYYIDKKATASKAGSVILMQCNTAGSKVTVKGSITYNKLKYRVTGVAGIYKGEKKADSVFKKDVTSVVLPDSLTMLGTNAFHGCSKIKAVSIPKSVKTIYNNAFYDCSNLNKITINSANISFPKAKAFTNINKKAAVSIPVASSINDSFKHKVEKQVGSTVTVRYNIVNPVIKVISNGKEAASLDTSKEKAAISGYVFSNNQIKKISYAANDEDGKTVDTGTVKNLKNFKLSCNVGIGVNTLTVSAVDSKGKKTSAKFKIIRKSAEVEYNDNVIIEDASNTAEVMGTIVKSETSGDNITLTFSDDSKVAADIKNGTLKKGDVYIIDSSKACPLGFSGVIKSIDSSNGSTVVTFRHADFNDIYKGDVCLKSSGTVDTKDPVAFTYFPESNPVSPLSSINSSNKSVGVDVSAEAKNNGIQFTCTTSDDGVSAKISLNDMVIYDQDGNKDTTNDQILLNGSYSVNDIKQEMFLDKQGLSIKQYYNKLSYTTEKDVNLEGKLSLDMKDLVKKFNDGFDNKKEYNMAFAKFTLEGVDTGDSIFLGAVGFNILTETPVAGVGSAIINESDKNINPIAFVAFILHLDGSISAEVSIGYNEKEYCAKGINLKSDGYSGGMPDFNDAISGVETFDVGNYTLQIINASCSDKELLHKGTDRNIYLAGKGALEGSFGAGLMSGLLLDGIIPAAVNVYGYIGVSGSAEGALNYSLNTKTISLASDKCKVSVNVDSGFAGRTQVKLNDIIDVSRELKVSSSIYKIEYPEGENNTNGRIKNDQNGHTYSIINLPLSWTEAEAYCESIGGHLMTVTSQEEEDFLENQLKNYGVTKDNYWLGATDIGHTGTWSWVTGEEFKYSKWDSGEPNNGRGGTEHYMGLYYEGYNKGYWNDFQEAGDVSRTLNTFGFICEWDQ